MCEGADSDRDHGLAEGDHHHQAVPLDEMAGPDPAGVLRHDRRDHHEERDGEAPEHVLGRAADDRSYQDERRRRPGSSARSSRHPSPSSSRTACRGRCGWRSPPGRRRRRPHRRSPNAVGIVSEIAKNASIPPSRGSRRAARSGGTALVSQANAPYIHQIAVSIRTTCASASPFGWWTSTAVSCVMVKTKTRSKKSSTRRDSELVAVHAHASISSLIGAILVTKSVISPESPVRGASNFSDLMA